MKPSKSTTRVSILTSEKTNRDNIISWKVNLSEGSSIKGSASTKDSVSSSYVKYTNYVYKILFGYNYGFGDQEQKT